MPMREDPSRLGLPRFIVTSTCGGGGKTLLSLGLAGALAARGLDVLPFKKGPDYIDAVWLSAAAGRPSTNLDPFFLSRDRLLSLFAHHAARFLPDGSLERGNAVAVIEGNRGLYDGLDVEGSCSTATLARDLGAPIVISLNATKMTRTAAAILQGLTRFEKGLSFAGVVLNQVGRSRHGRYLRQSIETYTDLPVLGELPRLPENPLPERHMGIASLLGDRLTDTARSVLDGLKAYIAGNVDVDRILSSARSAAPLSGIRPFWEGEPVRFDNPPVIGYVRDACLWFYYRENLEALERAGAKLRRLSFADSEPWNFTGHGDRIDAVYLGGGFPEDYLSELAASPRLAELAAASRLGLPVYAECGGLMVLSRSITRNGERSPAAGILPVDIEMHKRPVGLGYVTGETIRDTPFYPAGLTIRGHEFHFSNVLPTSDISAPCLRLSKGRGFGKGTDAITAGNTWGAYTHIFAPILPEWAEGLVRLARTWRG